VCTVRAPCPLEWWEWRLRRGILAGGGCNWHSHVGRARSGHIGRDEVRGTLAGALANVAVVVLCKWWVKELTKYLPRAYEHVGTGMAALDTACGEWACAGACW